MDVINESTDDGNTWITAVMTSAFVTGVYCTIVSNNNIIGIMQSMKKNAVCAAYAPT